MENTKEPKMVTITQEEYNRLIASENFLDCLRSAGVDNWDGYDDALDKLNIVED